MKIQKLFIVLGFFSCVSSFASTWPESKGYSFTTNWFGDDKISIWQKHLKRFKGQEKVRYLEVGVWEGRSFLWTLDHILTHPSSEAVAVDLFPFPIERTFQKNLFMSGHERRVKIFKERSEDVLPKLKKESFDIIYIDGAHDVKTVLIDAINSWNLLKNEGILIFDDYLMSVDDFPKSLRPQVAIDAFLLGFKNQLKILEKGQQVIVLKQPEPQPWCHSCTWFGDYRYDWYEGRLFKKWTGIKLVDHFRNTVLEKPARSELEKILRRVDQETEPGETDRLTKEAVKFAEKNLR